MERRSMLAALKSAARRLRNRTAGRSLPEAGEMFFALPLQDTARETVSRAAAAIAGRERAVQRISLPEAAEAQSAAARSTAALREGGAVFPGEDASAARTGSVSAPGEPTALPGGALSALSMQTAAALSGRENGLPGGARALFRSEAAFAVSGAAAAVRAAFAPTPAPVTNAGAQGARVPAALSPTAAAGEDFGRAARLGEAGAVTDGASVSRAAFVPAVLQSAAAAREDGEGGLRFVPQPMERVSSPALREADAGADAPRTVRRASGRGAGGGDGNFWEQWARRFAGELHSSPEGVHR